MRLNDYTNAKKWLIPNCATHHIYNRFLSKLRKMFSKNWNIISVNESLNRVFQNKLVIASKCNKNLKELIGSSKIENNIVKRINKSTLKPGKCSPCFGNSRTLCCNQVIISLTFKSHQTQKAYDFLRNWLFQRICHILDGMHVM